uniref:Uncharacterized protein n=1 Tax=Arundo donax TaxID=35708 RepID=A0A0A9BW77_ARUDO
MDSALHGWLGSLQMKVYSASISCSWCPTNVFLSYVLYVAMTVPAAVVVPINSSFSVSSWSHSTHQNTTISPLPHYACVQTILSHVGYTKDPCLHIHQYLLS